jgi:hypothetical protein
MHRHTGMWSPTQAQHAGEDGTKLENRSLTRIMKRWYIYPEAVSIYYPTSWVSA